MSEKLNLNPQAIVDKAFDIDFKGYNPDQVDLLLDAIIKDYQTYEKLVNEQKTKIEDLERINASLRAKLIEVEGKAKVSEETDAITTGASNVDILKRLTRLENAIFKNSNNNEWLVYIHETVADTYVLEESPCSHYLRW